MKILYNSPADNYGTTCTYEEYGTASSNEDVYIYIAPEKQLQYVSLLPCSEIKCKICRKIGVNKRGVLCANCKKVQHNLFKNLHSKPRKAREKFKK